MPRRPKRGQPTKLNAEVQEKIISAIRAGNHLDAAARFGGVSYDSLRKWVIWGEEGKEPYVNFCNAVKQAEADSEVGLVAQWKKHTQTNWVAAAALLERRFPERWSRKAADDPEKRKLELEKLQAEVELLKAKKAELGAGPVGDDIQVLLKPFDKPDDAG